VPAVGCFFAVVPYCCGVDPTGAPWVGFFVAPDMAELCFEVSLLDWANAGVTAIRPAAKATTRLVDDFI
jgi:hypothetical protein